MSCNSSRRHLQYSPSRYATLTSFALIKLFTWEAQLHLQWTLQKEHLKGSFALDSWFCVSKALNSKTSGLPTPIKASAPRPDHPLPDALTLKALVLSLYYHWVTCALGRWAWGPDISRPPFKESLPSTSSQETCNPYSILWPEILLQKKKQTHNSS